VDQQLIAEVLVRLRAQVKHSTGKTQHWLAHLAGLTPVKDQPLPVPSWVQIEPATDGYSLLYLDSAENCLTDTWHPSLQEAKAQAAFEFEIRDGDWSVV
jgi:hypothetical protein